MAATATATLRIDGTIASEPSGSETIGPLYVTSAAACYQKQVLILASGTNTITLPTGTGMPTPTGCIIIPDSANAVALTLKGVAGDTGITLSLTKPTVLTFPATPPASFVLTAASLFATPTTVLFF